MRRLRPTTPKLRIKKPNKNAQIISYLRTRAGTADLVAADLVAAGRDV
jgi:hypothetical protein